MHRIEAKAIDEQDVRETLNLRAALVGLIAIVGYAMLCGLMLLNTTGG